MKVLIVSESFALPGCLETSYRRAFESLGIEVKVFALSAAIKRYRRFGRIGQLLEQVASIESWIRKANRELVIWCQKEKPDLIVVVGGARITFGALAQVKSATGARTTLIWPDTLLNLNERAAVCLPLYDLVASYSAAAVKTFIQWGAKRVEWIPLGGDPHLYLNAGQKSPPNYECDVLFVGNWRPEREEVLDYVGKMKGVRLKIWGGNYWRRDARSPVVRAAWQGQPLYAPDFAFAVRAAKININVIDETNYPAANMRFFEIPCAGGLQLSSKCPEMEEEFKEGETIFYYERLEELPEIIGSLLADDNLRQSVADAAQKKIFQRHTYRHRAEKI
jgi:spore maturation protein CgeB